MFIYTRAAGAKIIDDLKKFIYIYNIVVQSFYIVYLIYALIVSAGNLIANIILLALSLSYLIFNIVSHCKKKKPSKALVKRTKRAYNYSKLAIKAVTLGATLYGLHIATSHVTTLSVILAALTTITWVLGVLFELLKIVLERYFELIATAVKTDVQPIMNIYNKLTGQESEPAGEPDKIDIYLKRLADELKREEDEKRAKQKAEREEKARLLKQAKRKALVEKVTGLFRKKEKAAQAEKLPGLTDGKEKKETAKK